jgi:predicted component of type VI protein secretion system
VGKLVLLLADGKTANVRLDKERVTIGRRADNDVCLPYSAVSSEHAAVVTVLGDSFLEDLHSTNGTLVNGSLITTRRLLRDGDDVDIGGQRLVYLVDDAGSLAPVPEVPAGTPARREADRGRRSTGMATAGPLRDGLPLAPPAFVADDRVSAPLPPEAAANAFPAIAPFAAAADPAGDAGTSAGASADPRRGEAAVPAAVDRRPAPEARAHARGERPAIASALICVRTGPRAGVAVALANEETLVGRIGVQVVAIRRDDGGFHVVPVDGAVPPLVNGIAIPAAGIALRPGDVLEVAGARLELAVQDVLAG